MTKRGFPQGNGNGLNPKGTKGWLWVLVTPLVVFFSVALSWSQSTAQTIIGKAFSGIVISDRYRVSNVNPLFIVTTTKLSDLLPISQLDFIQLRSVAEYICHTFQ